jgi:hypothetical protein
VILPPLVFPDLTNNMSLKPKMSNTAAAQHYRRHAEKNCRGACPDTDLSIQLFFSQFVEAGEFLTSVGAAVLRFEFSDLLGDLKPTIKPVACTIKDLTIVIYDRNDSDQYYKAINCDTRIVNYNSSVVNK